jgi:hypothetical protein
MRTQLAVAIGWLLFALALCVFGAERADSNARVSQYFIPNYPVIHPPKLRTIRYYRTYKEMIA